LHVALTFYFFSCIYFYRYLGATVSSTSSSGRCCAVRNGSVGSSQTQPQQLWSKSW